MIFSDTLISNASDNGVLKIMGMWQIFFLDGSNEMPTPGKRSQGLSIFPPESRTAGRNKTKKKEEKIITCLQMEHLLRRSRYVLYHNLKVEENNERRRFPFPLPQRGLRTKKLPCKSRYPPIRLSHSWALLGHPRCISLAAAREGRCSALAIWCACIRS